MPSIRAPCCKVAFVHCMYKTLSGSNFLIFSSAMRCSAVVSTKRMSALMPQDWRYDRNFSAKCVLSEGRGKREKFDFFAMELLESPHPERRQQISFSACDHNWEILPSAFRRWRRPTKRTMWPRRVQIDEPYNSCAISSRFFAFSQMRSLKRSLYGLVA